jgi:hypothetical protein
VDGHRHYRLGRFIRFILPALFMTGALGFAATALADSDDEPIFYSTAPVNDPIARFQKRLDTGEAKLDFDPKHGYLESALKNLKISASSQALVFSKTSFQRNLISPSKPRALYFSDDVYVGTVRDGTVLEVASIDPHQGTIFYTLKQEETKQPRFIRQTYDCTQCHESGMTRGVPGLLLRSVFPDSQGQPIFTAGTFATTDRSPLSERWGGWYVTGSCGRQRHMGNVTIDDEAHPEQTDFGPTSNVTSLAKIVNTTPYLRDTSDIVALLVFGHQQNLHNLITRANYDVRVTMRDSEALNKALGEPPGHRSESTEHRIQNACEPLVRAILFSGEAKLSDLVTGTSGFTREFSAQGPRDSRGRSLRDFDLTGRIFKYPCSYLICSEQFDGLPPEARDYVYRRLWEVLDGDDPGKAFAHLSDKDRRAIVQILRDTKKDLPAYWKRKS